jgi:hypothetical protein
VRIAAWRLLGALPTSPLLVEQLVGALVARGAESSAGEAAAEARVAALAALLFGQGARGAAATAALQRPQLLLYCLQALLGLLQPALPPPLAALAARPWRHALARARAEEFAVADVRAEAAEEEGEWWTRVASGRAGDALLPALARCVPLLGEAARAVAAAVDADAQLPEAQRLGVGERRRGLQGSLTRLAQLEWWLQYCRPSRDRAPAASRPHTLHGSSNAVACA